MTFDLLEKSRWLAKPQHFLRLSRGAQLALYTNADRPVTIGADTYAPLPGLTRSAIRDSSERKKNVVTLTLPIDAPCADWWYPYPRSRIVGVTWLAKHRGDSEVIVEWVGRVSGPKRNDTNLLLNCEQSKTNAASHGLVLRWQRGCPLALYSQGLGMCNVDKSLHAVPATLTDVAGTGLQAAAFGTAPLPLQGGFFEWLDADGEPEMRSIMAHSGELIVLNYGATSLADGTEGIAYPGCPHNFESCRDLFDNEENYGGSKYMPGRSVFDGNPR
jgi:hypothetical protein